MQSWTLLVYVNRADLCIAAAKDALGQTGVQDPRVLIVNNGGSSEDRALVERFCSDNSKALSWHHTPGLPSLSATWNRALEFVWESGGEEALVANNDIALTKDTYGTLKKVMQQEGALLVTATGVEGEEGLFEEAWAIGQDQLAWNANGKVSKGGPGFSCFLISKEGHRKYPFDEMLTPAFCEDLDVHRRYILGGDGDRIFGTNVRYLHLGGQTLKNMSPEQRERTERAITNGARAHYQRKWGGPANEEVHIAPFGPTLEPDGTPPDVPIDLPQWIYDRKVNGESVKNPDLFDVVREGWK